MKNKNLPVPYTSVTLFTGKKKSGLLYSLCFILFFLLLRPGLSAQDWQPLGPDDMNWPVLHGYQYLSMDVSLQGIPYVVYADKGVDNKVTCRQYQDGNWIYTGTPGFSSGAVAYTSVAISKTGTPWVIYQDADHEYKATVKRFISGSWKQAGPPGFTESYAISCQITFADNNTPYIVYIDGYGPLAGAVSVKKFTGGQWITVGKRQFSEGLAYAPSLTLDMQGIPYVMYQDNNQQAVLKRFTDGQWAPVSMPDIRGVTPSMAFNNNSKLFIAYYDRVAGKVRVKKQRENDWVDAGDPGFIVLGEGAVCLSISSNGIPYVAYHDAFVKKYIGGTWMDVGTPGQAGGAIRFDEQDIPYVFSSTVRKLTGGDWIDLGTRKGFSAGAAASINTAVDSNGMPYVVYQDLANSGKATVMKYENGSWMNTGVAGFSADSAWYTSIAIKNNGVPFVLYKDNGYFGRATVKKYSSYSWRNVGLPGFSAGEVAYTSIVMNSNGVPFVVYRDEGNGGKATVKKFSEGSWKNVGLPGFTPAPVTNTSIRMECGAVPWIVYRDEVNGNVELRKFQQGKWKEMPSPGGSSGILSGVDIAINEWGTPYVLFRESGRDGSIVVKYLTGNTWTTLGPAVESSVNSEFMQLRLLLDAGSDPYVLYIKSGPFYPESFVTNEIKVKHYNGSVWVDIWPSAQGGIQVGAASFAVKPAGQVVVTYNHSNSRGVFAKMAESTCSKPELFARSSIDQAAGDTDKIINPFTLYVNPNPVVNNATVYVSVNEGTRVTLQLTSMNGQLLWAKETFLAKGLSVLDLPVSQLTGGIYLLSVRTQDNRIASIRIIK